MVSVLNRLRVEDVRKQSSAGVTPLMVASALRSIDIVELLLECHADPLTKTARHSTVLHWAADDGNKEVCAGP